MILPIKTDVIILFNFAKKSVIQNWFLDLLAMKDKTIIKPTILGPIKEYQTSKILIK